MFTTAQVEYAVIGLIAVVGCLLLILLFQAVQLKKLNRKYKQLMRGMKDETIEEVLLQYITKSDQLSNQLVSCETNIEGLQKQLHQKAAKVSVERYNAYSETGNDLSFSIALLNDHNHGFVITSLYNRHDQRVYAKPVNNGDSVYPLTDEEKSVIAQAKQL